MLRVFASKSAAAVLAAGALTVSAGLATTGTASAAPARAAVNYVHCKIVSTGNYPPGRCYVVFDHSSYKRKAKVHFRSAGDFKPSEKVKVVLFCTKGYKRTEPNKAPHYARAAVNSSGRAHGHFEIPNKAPVGACGIEITGQTSHDQVIGTFRVKK